mmetsp:Transcript_18726/g.33218  ORF Transcript_18726/g.33218 Transcript_18726/m.33218 type:complete len:113 (+) Transcript_18726:1007-1345(+)
MSSCEVKSGLKGKEPTKLRESDCTLGRATHSNSSPSHKNQLRKGHTPSHKPHATFPASTSPVSHDMRTLGTLSEPVFWDIVVRVVEWKCTSLNEKRHVDGTFTVTDVTSGVT